MISHLIFVKLDDHTDFDALTADLGPLRAVDGIEAAELYRDVAGKTKGFDRLLQVDFRDDEAIAAWSTHELHLPIRDAIRANGEAFIFDYVTP